jgi:hypothetical protein
MWASQAHSLDDQDHGGARGSRKGRPEVERDEDLVDFARAGTRLGRVVVRVDGRRVGETPLVAREGYEEASFGQRVWYTVEGILE